MSMYPLKQVITVMQIVISCIVPLVFFFRLTIGQFGSDRTPRESALNWYMLYFTDNFDNLELSNLHLVYWSLQYFVVVSF